MRASYGGARALAFTVAVTVWATAAAALGGRPADAPRATAGDVRAPGAVATATLVPPVDWPDLPEVAAREPLTMTRHFAVHADDLNDPLLVDTATTWSGALEAILEADTQRAGLGLPREPIHVVFSRAYEARCPARGLAAPAADPPLIVVYVDEETTPEHLAGVLAHEIAHQITATEDFVGDGVLTEGIANWIAGAPMLEWLGLPSWDDAVRAYLRAGAYVSLVDANPLSPRDGEDCIELRDRVYAIRTSFVGWLIDGWGLGTVLAMPYREVDGRDADGTPTHRREPDYAAATGLDLADLERSWLRQVLRDGAVDTLLVRMPADPADARLWAQ